jgi:hypothetical protein
LRLLTKKDVARLPACSIRMVERTVASGTLTAVIMRGAVRFRSSDIEQIDRALLNACDWQVACNVTADLFVVWRNRQTCPPRTLSH